MKLNPPAFNRSRVMSLLPREAGGIPPVFPWSHLVPSNAAVPTGGWTTVRKDHFHSGDWDLQGLNVNTCSCLLCFCHCVLVNVLCCGEFVTFMRGFDSANISAALMLPPMILRKDDKFKTMFAIINCASRGRD